MCTILNVRSQVLNFHESQSSGRQQNFNHLAAYKRVLKMHLTLFRHSNFYLPIYICISVTLSVMVDFIGKGIADSSSKRQKSHSRRGRGVG